MTVVHSEITQGEAKILDVWYPLAFLPSIFTLLKQKEVYTLYLHIFRSTLFV